MAGAGAAAVAYWAATALAVAGTAYSAYTSRQSAKAQEEQSRINAEQEVKQGAVEAERIRELGRKQLSKANAQMAAQGLDLSANNTVVETVQKDITANASQDAWNTVFGRQANASQLNADAKNYNRQAQNIAIGGVLNTASTALSGYSGGMQKQKQGWA